MAPPAESSIAASGASGAAGASPRAAAGISEAADVVARLTGALAWQLDADGARVHWSAPFAAWLGAGAGAATLDATLAPLEADARERLRSLLQRGLAQGRPFDCVLPLARPRDGHAALRLRGERLQQPGGPCLLVIAAAAAHEAAADPPPPPGPQQRRLARQLALVTAANAIGLWEIDADSGGVDWNAQMHALYGTDAAEAPRQLAAWLDRHVLPDDHERLLRSTQMPAAAGDRREEVPTRRIEHRIVRADGAVRWIESQSALVVDDDGRRRIIGTSRDVTDRKHGEQELRSVLQRLEMATDWAGVGVFIRDPATEEGYWNAQMFQLLGLPPAPDSVAPPFAAVAARLHPDDRPAYLAHWADMRDPGVLVYPETPVRVRAADGSPRWLAIRGQRVVNAAGGEGRVAGVMLDITERMQSELRTQEIANWLELASRAGRIGITERNLDTGDYFWNPTLYEMLGLPVASAGPSEADLQRIMHAADYALLARCRQQALDSEDVIDFEIRGVHSDGRLRWFRTRLWAERRADGRPWRLLATLVDVTESHEANERLAAALQRLRLATEAGGVGTWEYGLQDEPSHVWDATMFALMEAEPPAAPTHEAILKRFHPADAGALDAWWGRILDGAQPQECEARLLRADGSIRHLVIRGQVERDEGGRPLRAVGTCVDISASRQAQAARQLAAERLALAQRTAGIGLWEYDPRSDALRIDETARGFAGVDAGVLATGAQYDARVHPDDRESLRAAVASAIGGDAESRCSYRLVRPDGALCFIEARFAIERDVRGQAVNVLGTLLDVTHLRQTEHERGVLIERLQMASKIVKMGIWERHMSDMREEWDAQLYDIYAIEHGRPMSRDEWLAHIHPDDRPAIERVSLLRESGADDGQPIVYRIVREDGEVRYVEDHLRVERDPQGSTTRILGVHVDISAQRRAQIERDEMLTRLQLAAEAVGFGIYEWQPQTGHSEWNDKMYALFGHTRASFADLTWKQAVHPDDLPRMKEALRRALDEAETFAFEYRTLWPDGTVRWIATRGRVQRDAAGRAQQVIGLHWDITESRLAESALRAKEMAERASAAKSEFLSRMSHELRTPLNAILGFTQLLEIDPRQPLTPPQQERIDHIKTAGWHLLALINEVLELSRIEAGAARIERSPVAVLPLVDACIALMRADADKRGIALESQARLPVTAWADPLRLRQVLLNLLSNAVKYNRDGGRVAVRVGGDAGQVRITVADTGRGLTASQLDKLYQPFNRLGLESAPIEGTGIGLTITLKLVEQMGGRLEVSSEPGIGSEFTVTLPALPAAAEAAPAASEPEVAAPAAPRGTVLYVEDNATNRDLLQALLRGRPDLRLLLAADGASGFALAQQQRPDLILLDMRLPDTDGASLLRRLRAQPATARIRCFAVSADALPADIDEALAAGFDDYLTKPLSMSDVLDRIDHALAAG